MVCLVSVGDADFSPLATDIHFLICNSSHHLQGVGESLLLFVETACDGRKPIFYGRFPAVVGCWKTCSMKNGRSEERPLLV